MQRCEVKTSHLTSFIDSDASSAFSFLGRAHRLPFSKYKPPSKMPILNDILAVVNEFLANPGAYQPALAAVKGVRNGVVYGARIRAPHALVMTFLFREGSLKEKFTYIIKATITHARNLAYFSFLYKVLKTIATLNGQKKPLPVFVSGFITGFIVFNKKSPVSNQIILYLLSRIIVGMVNLAVKKGAVVVPKGVDPFPWFAATVWGIAMVLFEFQGDTLQDSLRASLTYLHEDINTWHSLKDFLWHNK